MTKLKTLKDLQFECEWKFDTLKALKAEAVKWVKKFEEDKLNHNPSIYSIDWELQVLSEKQKLLKEFFNLSNEDLK